MRIILFLFRFILFIKVFNQSTKKMRTPIMLIILSLMLCSCLASLPISVDWRDKGWVTPVKDQGQCNSSYAFAATGSLEGQLLNRTGKLISLSEQQVIDCSTSYGNMGCSWGVTNFVFLYIKQFGGINSEASYRYTGWQGSCKARSSINAPGAKVRGWVDIQRGSEASLMQAVATIGPTTVAIDASQSGFQSYV